MDRLLDKHCDPRQYSPLTLAFIGDGVFDLMVRELLVTQANRPVGELNQLKVQKVCCKSQAEFAALLLPELSEEEEAVYRRGRNAHSRPPKNASSADYHGATGFEALWGYLYLLGRIGRLRELFEKLMSSGESDT